MSEKALIRLILILVMSASAALIVFYQYSMSKVPGHIAKSDRTMLMTDSMRHTFKVGLISQRALETYLRALHTSDQAKVDEALNLLRAALGFAYSGYIENQSLLETAVPLIRTNLRIIGEQSLAISEPELQQVEQNFDVVRQEVSRLEQEIWIKFQTDFVAFQSNEYRLQLLYQVTTIASIVILTSIALLFFRQKRLISAIVEQQKHLKKSEERFSLAMNAAQDALWDLDLPDQNAYFSPAWQRILGEKTLPGNYVQWQEHIHPHDRARVVESFDAHLLGLCEHWREEYRMARHDGSWVWVLGRGQVVERNAQGKALRVVGTITDISERKKSEEKLSYQATHDRLTGLINRHEFERKANLLLDQLDQEPAQHALCFMDLDQFKVLNDTCGHTAGDALLSQLSEVLRQTVRKNDTLARLGGDEFAVLMEQCTLKQAQRAAQALLNTLHDFQFYWEEQNFHIGASIGLVAIKPGTPGFTELLKQADAACYAAKDLGRNRIHTYNTEDIELARRQGEMQWVSRITQALEQGSFCLFAQPIVALEGNQQPHYELLLRMLGKNGDIIPPGAFMSSAERYNLMGSIDTWVITRAFEVLEQHPAFLNSVSFVSINLSGPSLTNHKTLKFISSQLRHSGIDPQKICFEITESVAVSNLSEASKFIATLKKIGCLFALDDFGSGLSSFGYLKNLPADYLKIDGMFVKDIVEDPMDYAMVKAIHEIGKVMKMQTIAEFVENDQIKDKLKVIGVDYAQGYGVGEPKPLLELLAS